MPKQLAMLYKVWSGQNMYIDIDILMGVGYQSLPLNLSNLNVDVDTLIMLRCHSIRHQTPKKSTSRLDFLDEFCFSK